MHLIKRFSFWALHCTMCDELYELSPRKKKATMCRKCDSKLRFEMAKTRAERSKASRLRNQIS